MVGGVKAHEVFLIATHARSLQLTRVLSVNTPRVAHSFISLTELQEAGVPPFWGVLLMQACCVLAPLHGCTVDTRHHCAQHWTASPLVCHTALCAKERQRWILCVFAALHLMAPFLGSSPAENV
jgi:hypothetical protein